MASARKPLFMGSEGFHEELGLTSGDWLNVSKIVIPPAASGGVGINMGGDSKITNASPATTPGDVLVYGQDGAKLGTTVFEGNVQMDPGVTLDMNHNPIINVESPTNPDDAATKAYVDAVVSGLDPHASVMAKTPRCLGTQAVRAGAGGGGVALPMADESFDLTIHNPAATTVSVVFTDEATLADVADTINTAMQAEFGGSFNYAVVNGNNIDLYDPYYGGVSRVVVSNVVETNPGDLAGKTGITAGTTSGTGFTAAGAGVGKTLTAPTNSVAFNTIDGVTFTATGAAYRVLVSAQGGEDAVDDPANGIYYVSQLGDGTTTPFQLTRATDADQAVTGELVRGLYVFVSGGTLYSNTGWSEVDVVTTVDTSLVKFTQFSGAPGYTFDQGLKRDVNSIQVELDTDAPATGAGAGGGSSGLEFDVNTAAGQLRAAVSATGGLKRASDGLSIKFNPTNPTLVVDGSGNLDVKYDSTKGLGTSSAGLYVKVDGTTIGYTGGNLYAIGSGVSDHAKNVENTFNSATDTLAVGDPVYINGTDTVGKARADTDAKARVIGIDRSGAGAPPQAITVVSIGPAAAVLSLATPNTPYYLQSAGGIGTGLPGAGNRVIQIGKAINDTDLFVDIIDYGKKAA